MNQAQRAGMSMITIGTVQVMLLHLFPSAHARADLSVSHSPRAPEGLSNGPGATLAPERATTKGLTYAVQAGFLLTAHKPISPQRLYCYNAGGLHKQAQAQVPGWSHETASSPEGQSTSANQGVQLTAHHTIPCHAKLPQYRGYKPPETAVTGKLKRTLEAASGSVPCR